MKPVRFVPNQEKETTVSAQMECGITTELVKIVVTCAQLVPKLVTIVMVTAQKTELEMIVTVQMLIMTTMFQENAQNVVVNVQNVILMVVRHVPVLEQDGIVIAHMDIGKTETYG